MTLWGYLLHISYNMWEDVTYGEDWGPRRHRTWSDDLQCDDALWAELTQRMSDVGLNMVTIDLGDGIRYESHPEIATKGAWSVERLRDELVRLRELGLEPLPKLNFSAGHDAWLGEYARQVSTPAYYKVCSELIAEVSELFEKPRLFHIGMDEETALHQEYHEYMVIRQHDLWWRDLGFLADEVTKNGSRPWMWSDHAWRLGAEYYERMSTSIVQSNWYYGDVFTGAEDQERPRRIVDRNERYLAYLDLNDHGFDQIPTGSVHLSVENLALTVEFCRRRLAAGRLLGFLQAPWKATVPEFRDRHFLAIEQVGRVINQTAQAASRHGRESSPNPLP